MAASGSSSQILPTVHAVVSRTTTLGSFINSIKVGIACKHNSYWQSKTNIACKHNSYWQSKTKIEIHADQHLRRGNTDGWVLTQLSKQFCHFIRYACQIFNNITKTGPRLRSRVLLPPGDPPAPTPRAGIFASHTGDQQACLGPRKWNQCLDHLLLIGSPAPRLVSGGNLASSPHCVVGGLGGQLAPGAAARSSVVEPAPSGPQVVGGARGALGWGGGRGTTSVVHSLGGRVCPRGGALRADAGCLLGL